MQFFRKTLMLHINVFVISNFDIWQVFEYWKKNIIYYIISNMNYYEKYLKYKTKYLKLKNMNGGNFIIE